MDLYSFSLLLGLIGLSVMALSGLGHHGHDVHAGHDVHPGHDAHAGHDANSAHDVHSGHDARHLWSLASPRLLFSFALGFGAAGLLLGPFAGGIVQLAIALLGGVLLERGVVSPLWNFTMRFASAPAVTLERAVTDEATAVTSFDGNGQGIVSLEVDGQVLQILATLQTADRELGARVRAGQRLRIEDVDRSAQRCTVSVL
jgi:hypothetical protein